MHRANEAKFVMLKIKLPSREEFSIHLAFPPPPLPHPNLHSLSTPIGGGPITIKIETVPI